MKPWDPTNKQRGSYMRAAHYFSSGSPVNFWDYLQLADVPGGECWAAYRAVRQQRVAAGGDGRRLQAGLAGRQC